MKHHASIPQANRTPDMLQHAVSKQFFSEQGFLVLEDFYSASECQQLMAHMHQLIDACDFDALKTIFSTDGLEHIQDGYFQNSGDKIRFFLEKGAFDKQGRLIAEKHKSVNKVGHALHDLDPVFSTFSRKPALAKLTEVLGLTEPLLLQSMYIFKPPKIGGAVSCHQDSTFLYTQPESVIGFWIALEEATINNGCLWVEPGGHKQPLRQRFHFQNGKLTMTPLSSTPLPEPSLPLEVKQGTLVILHGRLPHASLPNTSDRSREAYTLHVIDGNCMYPDDNWLHRAPDIPLKGF